MQRRQFLAFAALAPAIIGRAQAQDERVRYFQVTRGSGSRDVVCPRDQPHVWYCGQRNGTLNRLDPRDGGLHEVALGQGSAPHGVVLGPDGGLWVTDGGLNAIVRVDPANSALRVWRLPADRARANLNTGVFDQRGMFWFTGQNGIYGRFDPRTEAMQVWTAPRGRGPYGITLTPSGQVWYASLAGNHIARINTETGEATVVEPPTREQGARRIWTDSRSRLWVSEWNSGNVSVYDTSNQTWRAWRLPGERPRTYAVYVDAQDIVWLTDFGGNAIVRFDPRSERFTSLPSDRPNANVRQVAGRPGEVWGGETGTDRMVLIQTPA